MRPAFLVKEEEEEAGAKRMQEHRDFTAKRRKGRRRKTRAARFRRCRGSYILRIEVSVIQREDRDRMSIDIDSGPTPNILQGAMFLRMYCCTMLLAFAEATLDAYVREVDEDVESDNQNTWEEQESRRTAYGKRKAPPTAHTYASAEKRKRTDHPTDKRLFFRIRGQDNLDGQIFYIPRKGHLEFTGSDFVAFKGVMELPRVANYVSFECYKIDAEARDWPSAWSEFSRMECEQARCELLQTMY